MKRLLLVLMMVCWLVPVANGAPRRGKAWWSKGMKHKDRAWFAAQAAGAKKAAQVFKAMQEKGEK